jgi:putative membrane protein
MSALKHIVAAGGGLAVALLAPMIALQAQVTAPGTNPKPGAPTTSPAPAPTANPAATPSQTGDREMTNDLPFLREAAGVNLMEIRLGQLAQGKASNAAVKQFGQRMVNDHTRLEQDLSSMVSANGIALNPTLTPAQNDNITRLQNFSGPQFDQAYMSLMIQGHQTDVAQFDTQSRNADSPQVRDFAARSLPVLQQHLTLAQQVGSQVNANGVVTTTPKPGQGRQADVRADNEFIREVVADATLEVQMAQLAERKGQSSAVKQLATRIAADHNRLQDEWLAIASSNGQPFKPGFGKNHKAKLDAIQKLSGRAFDRAYISTMVRDHRDYINYFEKECRSANSSQVRELVNRDLPTLRSNFNQGKQVGAQIGADVNVTLRSERGSAKK